MTPLRRAYETIKAPERWAQGDGAHDALGKPVDPLSPRARSWCAVGALLHAYGVRPDRKSNDHRFDADIGLLESWSGKLFHGQSIVLVNDTLGHEAVVQVFEKALVELEGSL